jgi:WS/DGAT/MGAT family acyltransferase
MSKQPLSSVDAAWYGMEDPTNLMMVSGIMTFDRPIDFDKLNEVIEQRWLKFQRFRQRVVRPRNPLAAPYWEDDPQFELSAHVRRLALPAPGDQAVLQETASVLMSTPLDYSKPLWQFHLIEGYGEGCALMGRLHHCLADGMALMFVLLSMTDMQRDARPPKPELPSVESVRGGYLSGSVGRWAKQAKTAVKTTLSISNKLLDESRAILDDPNHLMALAKQAADLGFTTGRVILRPPDRQSIFRGKLGVAKRAAWSRPLPLSDIKAIKNVTGGTINDVLITAIAGGLRRYMLGRGEEVEGVDFRATVPVNLRKPEEMGELGHKFGLVYLKLPIYIEDVLERLHEVRQRMSDLKNSSEAAVALAILSGIGLTPADVQQQLVNVFGAKATAVMTNVPGPPVPLYLAGSKITGIMFWVPQAGRVALGISIISYAGNVWLGVATDARLIPDPDQIIEGFYEEYDLLREMAQTAEDDITVS